MNASSFYLTARTADREIGTADVLIADSIQIECLCYSTPISPKLFILFLNT